MERGSVYGPYEHRSKWRVEVHVTKGGRREKSRRTFATESDALEFKRAVEREIYKAHDAEALRGKAEELRRLADQYSAEADHQDAGGMTVTDAVGQYERYMLHDKGNKARSVETTGRRLRALLGDGETRLASISEHKAGKIYDARRQGVSVDTHRNELGQVKTFMVWCVERGWIRRNPFAKVKGVGKRRRGKQQLRIEETRRIVRVALAEARAPDQVPYRRRDAQHRESSLALLVVLYLGLRAFEVVNMRRRDVDDGGRVVWIPDSKTENGRRTLEVAEVLRPLLWRHAQASGEASDARVFAHDRVWVLYNAKRLCRKAEVPEITAHGVRGMHATIATQMGATSHIVAHALGHGDPGVTERHYIQEGATGAAARERVRQLLEGDRSDQWATDWATERATGPSEPTWGKDSPESFPQSETANQRWNH